MHASFTPLLPKTASPDDPMHSARLIVIDPTQSSFSLLRSPAEPAPEHSACTDNSSSPMVRLRKEGDRITGFQIECPCGQIFDFSCVY